MSSRTIFSRREQDGRFTQKTETGWVEVEAPAFGENFPSGEPVYDPENPPATDEQLKRARRMSLAKRLRIRLGLTQTAFAERYRIPVGTLRDWEQHRTEPDAPAKALLHLIASDPEGAAEKLGKVHDRGVLAGVGRE